MCHITDPAAHYEAPCSQLSEPLCWKPLWPKKKKKKRERSVCWSGSSRSTSNSHSLYERQNRKLTFGRCLWDRGVEGGSMLSATSESGDRASDLYHGNNDLFWCQELWGVTAGNETPLSTCDSFWRRELALGALIALENQSVCDERLSFK